MAKGYWMSAYRSIKNQEALAIYAKLATAAINGAGGRFIFRGMPSKVFEAGVNQRTVVIEFDSVARAIAAYESPEYQNALAALGDAAERDFRIMEGT